VPFRFCVKLILRKEFIFELMTAGNARVYALIADQTPRPEDPKLWTRFLQQDTAFFVGAGKIAKFLDAQVVYVDMQRVCRGHYTVRFNVLVEPPYAEGEDALVVQRYASELEQAVRASPADWLWLQKKWKYAKPPPTSPVDSATEPGLAIGE
jgi:KDO2-lipid IV(A) lauroyltransferase